MPRYVRKISEESSKIDVNNIVKAIIDMKKNGKSERAAGKEYKIPTTSLHQYKKKVEQEFPNFDAATVDEITKFVESTVGWGTQTVSSKYSSRMFS